MINSSQLIEIVQKLKNDKLFLAGIVLLAIMLIFSACTSGAESETISSDNVSLQTYTYTANDLNDQWNEEDATAVIRLADNDTEITGSGAFYSANTLTINEEGTYVISGKLTNGQIMINADDNSDVHIILNSVDITNESGPAIYEKTGDKTILTLAEKSENTLSDGASYKNTGDDDPDAALYATHDLSINGSGEITVTGKYNNGIGTQDDLAIVDSTLNVTAENNGIKGRDLLAVKDAIININSANDGLKSNNDSDTTKGFIQIDSGTIDITANNDGIQAETNLIVNDGDIRIKTTGTGYSSQSGDTTSEDSQSFKALKAVSGISIKGGTFDLDSTDDAIHSNGNVTIDGGTFTIATGDDGVHADSATVINGGTIDINESYEGLEGATVEINGGTINITSLDDGINAAGGSDDETSTDENTDNQDSRNDGSRGRDQFTPNEYNHIKINGGNISILAGGDGIDSNGELYFEGGKIDISGPTSGPEGALDANGDIHMNGGELTSSGNTSMAETPADDSMQSSLIVYYSSMESSNDTIYIKDVGGNEILNHTPQSDFQLTIFSSSKLEQGQTYSVYSGDKKLFDIELTQTNTVVDETGKITELNGMGRSGGTTQDERRRPQNDEQFPDDEQTPQEQEDDNQSLYV